MIQLPEELVKKIKILTSTVRYGDLPAKESLNSDTAIFFIAGQKSPLERFFPMAEYFAQYYHTYAYEIPGMGIGHRAPNSPATIEVLGDEVAKFIEEVITEKDVIIIAASAGFWFSTQGLLSHNSAQTKVKKVLAIVGMLGKDTFGFSKAKRSMLLAACKFSQSKFGSGMINWLLGKEKFVDVYAKYLVRRRHLDKMPEQEMYEHIEFEKFLLRLANWDIHFSTIQQYLTCETPCNGKLDIPLFALYSEKDQFFPYENQKKMFERVYNSITWDQIHLKAHAPLVVKNFDEYKDVIPEERILEFLSS